jgi:prophage regulatory protein
MSDHRKTERPRLQGLLRLPAVLALFPVSRSAWYEGVKLGKYPSGVKLGTRAVAWRAEDIDRLLTSVSG